MGRGQKRGWGGGGGRGGGRGGDTWRQDKRSKKDFTTRDDMRNAAFEEYYRAQDIIPADEWGDFLATLRRPLPVTFRINGSGKFADHLRDKLQQDFFAKLCGDLMIDGEAVTPPRQLPWYPNGYAWQLEFSRNLLRKSPILSSIHDFVKHANDAGSISRQEAVSMVPPLFLDVQPHHRVLDMCAAPGSKTFQLLEALHAGSRPGQTPPGFVVANDADFMRCNLLTHQTKRVCSPCLLVTNHDASRFPAYLAGAPQTAPPPPAAAAAATPEGAAAEPGARCPARPPRYQVRFDRILADVPCSGDGTLRKSPDIWRKWNIGGGNSLHPMQLRIAMHGAKLLEVGGRMVYSTCTFNPVEDEAVVAELLLRCGGALELVDVSECMPQLRRMAGKHQWKVKDKHRFYSSWDEARDIGYKLDESMFPSPAKAALPLERCMRFLPHHGDTGGFFVAVLRKVSELPAEVFRQARKGTVEAPAAVPRSSPATAAASETTGTGLDANGHTEPVADNVDEDGEEDGEEDEAAAAVVACAAAGLADAEGGNGDGDGDPGKDADVMEDVDRPAAPEVASGDTRAAAEEPASWDSPKPTSLEVARAAAEAAIAAAESALAAYEAGDLESALRASSNADASARRAVMAAQRDKAAPRVRESQGQRQQQQQQRDEEAHVAEEEPADGEQAGPVQTSWIRGGGGRGRPDGGKYAYIDPVAPLEDDSVLSILYDYYGIPPDFPLRSQLVMRALDRHPKRLYFVARSVLDLMMQDSREVLKIVSTGLKVFERQLVRDQVNECPYRLSQEGLPLVLPYITRQRIEVPPKVLVQLLRDRNLILPSAAAVEGETTPSGNPRGNKPTLMDESVQAALAPLKLGCLVCELSAEDAHRLGFAASVRASPEETKALLAPSSVTAPQAVPMGGAIAGDGEEVTGGLAANAPLAVVAWKGPASLAIMVEKAECAQMLDKLESELKKPSM